MENYFHRLGLVVQTDNEKKILDLFEKRAGKKLEIKAKKALNLMADGKTFGRALADSLETK